MYCYNLEFTCSNKCRAFLLAIYEEFIWPSVMRLELCCLWLYVLKFFFDRLSNYDFSEKRIKITLLSHSKVTSPVLYNVKRGNFFSFLDTKIILFFIGTSSFWKFCRMTNLLIIPPCNFFFLKIIVAVLVFRHLII